MSSAKLAVLLGLTALGLSACGTTSKPLAGTLHPATQPLGRGRIDDPRTAVTNHVACLRQDHLPAVKAGSTNLQVGPLPGGPTIDFAPTPGIAQGLQIEGQAQGAEVIGSALLYPNQGSDKELKQIESCLAKGVLG